MTDAILHKNISSLALGQRVEETQVYPYGFKLVEAIPANQLAVLLLGGSGALTERATNGYLSSLQKWLQGSDIKDKVALYGAIYDMRVCAHYRHMCDSAVARRLLFQQHHHAVKVEKYDEDSLNPAYVEDLFNQAFLHRISDEQGQRLSVKEACARMRKLTVFAHCHGAYTFLKLEEKMQQKMRQFGYMASEREKILQEMVCVAHAPHAPLGVTKAVMISFASAKDGGINHYNHFVRELWRLPPDKVLMSYFPGRRGELVLAPGLGDVKDQHTFAGLTPDNPDLDKYGLYLFRLERATLLHALCRSAMQRPQTAQELICGPEADLKAEMEILKSNGDVMWNTLRNNARKHCRERRQNTRV